MNIQKLKTLQAICGSIMVVCLVTYIYMDWKLDYNGQYYLLVKGLFLSFLALTFHFGLSLQKITEPAKYKPVLHTILVGIWGTFGVITVVNFLMKLF